MALRLELQQPELITVRQYRAFILLCRGWGETLEHRNAGGVGYPRNQSYRRRGRRGSPSNLPSLGEAYLMIEAFLKGQPMIARLVLAFCFCPRRNVRGFATALYGDSHPGMVKLHRRIRLELARRAINELGL